MDSHVNVGVRISTTQAAPKVPFATSTGIRAPLTIDDDDFNYPASSGGKKGSFFGSFSSDSGLEFESDEYETASGSDRPFLADIDDEIVEETHFEKEYVVSRPIVINQCDDNFAESSSDRDLEPNFIGEGVVAKPIEGNHCDEQFDESSNISKLRISRELLLYSNKDLLESNDSSKESSECGTFVVDTEEDAVGISYEVDDNDSLPGLTIVDNDLMMKQNIPVAQVCWSSDDDFLGDEVSSVDFEVTERFENAPKIGVLALSEYVAEEDSAFSDNHDRMIVNSTVKAPGYYLSADAVDEADVVEDNFADKTVKVNEGFQELERNSFELNISASENLGSKQAVQKSDWEVQSYASDVPTNTELFNTSVIEEEGQSLNNADFGATPTAERSEACGNNSYVADIVQSLVMEDEYYSASENLGSKQVSVTEEEGQNLNNADFGATPTAERSEACGNNYASDIVQSLVMEDKYYSESNLEATTTAVRSESFGRNRCGVDLVQSLVMEDEYYSESNLEATPAAVRSESFGRNRCGVDLVQSLVMEDEYYSESNLEATPAAVRSESFGINRCGVDIIQSLVMEDEYCCGSEVSQAGLQSFNVDLSSIHDKIDSVSFEREEDFLTYDETQIQEVSDRASGVVLLKQLLTDTLSSEESVENDFQSVGAQTMSESDEELEAHKDSLGEEISASSPAIINVTVKSDDASPELMASKESGDMSNVEENKKLVKLQQLRIKFFRLALKLNQSFDDTIAANVLDKIMLAAERPAAQSFNFESAKQTAILLEAEGAEHLDFSLNILVIGKSGVGKSATINSLFGEDIATTNPFQPSTTSVKIIKRTMNGVQVRVLDTPGLRSYPGEQSFNRRVLLSIKKHMNKFPPDVVLYVDRLDMQYADLNDVPLLKAVTCYLGSSIWVKTIVTLTHATSAPPEVLSGSAFSYQFFVTRQSEAVQQLISHVVDGHAIKPGPVNISLVENQAVSDMLLPDGSWKEKLLFLCYSLKILSEIDLIIKPKAFFDYRKFFGFNNHSVPILSSFLLSNVQPNSVTTCDDENFDSEDEYDQPLPFKPLRRYKISKLKEEQQQAYFEEYDYHEKLLQKKQMRDEVTNLELVKKQRVKSDAFMEGYLDQQAGNHTSLAVPILPPPFDVKNLAYWDNDCGYDGVMTRFDNETCGEQVIYTRKDQSLFGLSLMRWGGDSVWGLNMQSQFSVGQSTRVCVHAGVHNKKSSQVSFRVNSSNDIPIAILLGFIPIAKMIFMSIFAQTSER